MPFWVVSYGAAYKGEVAFANCSHKWKELFPQLLLAAGAGLGMTWLSAVGEKSRHGVWAAVLG